MPGKDYVPYHKYDRWAQVPPELAQKWAPYREPPLPLSMVILRKACRYGFIGRNVARVRRYLAWIPALRRTIFIFC